MAADDEGWSCSIDSAERSAAEADGEEDEEAAEGVKDVLRVIEIEVEVAEAEAEVAEVVAGS